MMKGNEPGHHPQLTASLLGGYGHAMWQMGTRHLLGHPLFVVQWTFYRSPLTGLGGPDARLARFLTASSIAFNEIPFPLEAPPVPLQAVPIAVRNLNGTAAEAAEILRLKSTFGDSLLNFATSPGATRMKVGGANRYPDAKLTVADLWEGAVEIASEAKCGLTRFQGCSGGTVAFEALVDSALVSGVNHGRASIRGLGQTMRGLGVALGFAGGLLDVAAAADDVRVSLAAGDVAAAWWTGADLLARWSGLVAGAVWGGGAGPVGALVGGFLGAFYGGQVARLAQAFSGGALAASPTSGFLPQFENWNFQPGDFCQLVRDDARVRPIGPGDILRRELRDGALIDVWGIHREPWQHPAAGTCEARHFPAGFDVPTGKTGQLIDVAPGYERSDLQQVLAIGMEAALPPVSTTDERYFEAGGAL